MTTLQRLDLQAGDKLTCDTHAGTLSWVRSNGEAVDLIALQVEAGATSGSGEGLVQALNLMTFLALASAVAITHGLSANEVEFRGPTFTAELT